MFKYVKMLECNKWLDTFKYKMVIVLGIFSLFFNLVSCSASQSVKADDSVPPGKPTDLVLAEDANDPTTAIRVSWKGPTDPGKNGDGSPATISKYVVEWSANSNFLADSSSTKESKESTETNVTINTIDEQLIPGIQYYVRVSAVNSAGLAGGFSQSESVKVETDGQSAAPGAPTDLVLVTDTDSPSTAIDVSWVEPTDPGTNIDGSDATITKYLVQWSTDSDFPMDENTKNEESTTASYTITGLTAGTQYYVRVKAINSAELAGGFSQSESVTVEPDDNTVVKPDGQPVPPGIPTGLVLVTDTDSPTTAIRVSWTEPIDTGKEKDGSDATISKYVVEWSTDKTFPVDSSTTKGSTGTSVVIDRLTSGTQYYVRVKAFNSAELAGRFSLYDSKSTSSEPGAPIGLTLSKNTDKPATAIDVSWGEPSDTGKEKDGSDAAIN